MAYMYDWVGRRRWVVMVGWCMHAMGEEWLGGTHAQSRRNTHHALRRRVVPAEREAKGAEPPVRLVDELAAVAHAGAGAVVVEGALCFPSPPKRFVVFVVVSSGADEMADGGQRLSIGV